MEEESHEQMMINQVEPIDSFADEEKSIEMIEIAGD